MEMYYNYILACSCSCLAAAERRQAPRPPSLLSNLPPFTIARSRRRAHNPNAFQTAQRASKGPVASSGPGRHLLLPFLRDPSTNADNAYRHQQQHKCQRQRQCWQTRPCASGQSPVGVRMCGEFPLVYNITRYKPWKNRSAPIQGAVRCSEWSQGCGPRAGQYQSAAACLARTGVTDTAHQSCG